MKTLHAIFSKLLIFISCYVCSFVMTIGKEHDNLFRRVSLPSASNYGRMRGARAGFVLKVNILYIKAYPVFERFLLSTKWTSSYMSSDEVCTHRGAHVHINTHVQRYTHWTDAHTWPHPPTHTLTCWLPVYDFFFLFCFCFSFDVNVNAAERSGIHFYFLAVPFNLPMPLLINSFLASHQCHFYASQLVTLALIKAPAILQRSIIRTKAGGVTQWWHTRHTLKHCLCHHISFKQRKKANIEEKLFTARYAHHSPQVVFFVSTPT